MYDLEGNFIDLDAIAREAERLRAETVAASAASLWQRIRGPVRPGQKSAETVV